MNYSYDEAVTEMERLVELMKDLLPSDAHRISSLWGVLLQGDKTSEEAIDSAYDDGYQDGKNDGHDKGYDEGYEAGYADCESEWRSEYGDEE